MTKVHSGVREKENSILGGTQYYGWAMRNNDASTELEGPDHRFRWLAKLDAYRLARRLR